MKKLRFFAMSVILLYALASCQKEQVINPSVPSTKVAMGTPDPGDSGNQLKMASFTESMVTPKFGKPNSTYYSFKVYDLSGALPLSVKLYEKATGTTTYLPMTRSGSYWVLSVRITNNGWYDWRYVYTASKANISSYAYVLCNTNNTFSAGGISSISWPFGADGSSWGNRTVSSQTWRGGEEGGNGDGWGQGSHIGITEQFSDDWNRGNGSQDFGAEIRSPLDGYVEQISSYPVSGYGNSKYVSIIQETDGKIYRFYVAHLNSTESSLYSGQYVRAGITKIGTLGMTGASSPHAHTNLRDITNGSATSVKFYFNAN